jgi:DNA-binding transcriptional regulator YiaG
MKNPPIRDNYTCPECGGGTVRATRFSNYRTKFKGYSFVVDEAWIGVCENCDARIYSPKETQRWNALFSQSLIDNEAYLSPSAIRALPAELGLSTTDFALLIGSTRQSLHNWTRPEHESQPGRSADLLMRLVQASYECGEVDVIEYLVREAAKWGVNLQVQRPITRSE